MEISAEKINDLRKQYGEVHVLRLNNKAVAVLKPIDRATLKLALSKIGDPLGSTEVLVKNLWLAGDDALKEDLGFLMGIGDLVDLIIKKKPLKLTTYSNDIAEA